MEYDWIANIPIQEHCSLWQACEYLAFCKKPMDPHDQERVRHEIMMLNHTPDTHDFDRFLLQHGDPRYNKAMEKVFTKLHKMLKSGTITATYKKNQDLQNNAEAVPLKVWEKNITLNNIESDIGSYCNATINFEQLTNAAPVKRYNVRLDVKGLISVTDGKSIINISKTEPGHKTYEWLKFLFEHPNQTISKEDLIEFFENTDYKYVKNDRMSQCVFSVFSGNTPLMHCCFPVVCDKSIYCTPTFFATDALVS